MKRFLSTRTKEKPSLVKWFFFGICDASSSHFAQSDTPHCVASGKIDSMNSIKGCEVCTVLPTNHPIFETERWMVSLSSDQGYLGRCYVTLKEHKSDLADLTTEEWLEFSGVVKTLEEATRQAFGATLFNWGCLMNNAFQSSPALPHIHWHVRPRYQKPVLFEDIEFVDPEFGHHYDRQQKNIVDEITLRKIRSTIQEML